MDSPLPTNETLEAFSKAVPWQDLERQRDVFSALLAVTPPGGTLPLARFSEALGVPVTTWYPDDDPQAANVILGEKNGQKYILGSVVSARYRGGNTLTQSIVPYNLNPAVNHTNIRATQDSPTRIRAMGAELELGLLHRDGSPPTLDEVQTFIQTYQNHARRLKITQQVDYEACEYQVEVHVAPGVGYHRTRQALGGIMQALAASGEATHLQTAILSAYPIKSDFVLSQHPKIQTAVDLMVDVNSHFPDYIETLEQVKARYHIDPAANCVEAFRLQGCHIHIDIAGRSEALGLLAFHTLLRSASAVANSAILKGGPFVNGTCDRELLCTREFLRGVTVTGRTIEMPLSPHLKDGDLDRYATLLRSERANSPARALLYDDSLGSPISAMHSLVGRLRSDLPSSHRICTLESTGMPVNVSASRQAAVLTDFEFSQTLLEIYFRRHGCNLEPMMADAGLWDIIGPLSPQTFADLHAQSDRECSDITLRTAGGREMSLPEFYELKRHVMYDYLIDSAHIPPRDIDDVYHNLQRMLNPPGGKQAQTIEQYIYDFRLRNTGNWGKILRNAFIEEGGTPGEHDPDVVLRVTNRIHDALCVRYLE